MVSKTSARATWRVEIRIIAESTSMTKMARASDASSSSTTRLASWLTCQASPSLPFQSRTLKTKRRNVLRVKPASKPTHPNERTQSLQLIPAIFKLSPKTTKHQWGRRLLRAANIGRKSSGQSVTSVTRAYSRCWRSLRPMSASSISQTTKGWKTRPWPRRPVRMIRNCRWKRKSPITPKSGLNYSCPQILNSSPPTTVWVHSPSSSLCRPTRSACQLSLSSSLSTVSRRVVLGVDASSFRRSRQLFCTGWTLSRAASRTYWMCKSRRVTTKTSQALSRAPSSLRSPSSPGWTPHTSPKRTEKSTSRWTSLTSLRLETRMKY